MILKALILYFFAIQITKISGHGRLMSPVSRTSAWRKYPSLFPAYFQDNQMFCGGFHTQFHENGGECGICGESASLPKRFEKGGDLYRNLIVEEYLKGQIIEAELEITANHYGYFEFKICNVDGSKTDATQACLDKTILADSTGRTKFPIERTKTGSMKFKLNLPGNLLCNHCVFQWVYTSGNSWGEDPITGRGGIGVGNQEQFYGCSDIQISLFKHGNALSSKSLEQISQVTFPEDDKEMIDEEDKEKMIEDINENVDAENNEFTNCGVVDEAVDDIIGYLQTSLFRLSKLKESMRKQTVDKEINRIEKITNYPSIEKIMNDPPKQTNKKFGYPYANYNYE